MKFPRMDWYPWDFDEDEYVKLLPWSQQNAYMRILTVMWKWADKHDTVDLPDDDFRIAGAIGISPEEWAPLRERLVTHPAAPLKHDPEAHVIYSPRIRAEYQKALNRTGSYSERGKKGGRGKRHGEAIEKLPESYSFTTADQEESNSETEALYHLSLNRDQEIKTNNNDNAPVPERDNADPLPEVLRLEFTPKQVALLTKAWESKMGGTVPSLFIDRMKTFREANGPPLDIEVFTWAIDQCALYEKRTLAYLETILKNCQARGHTSLVHVLAYERQREAEKPKGVAKHGPHATRVNAGRHDDLDSLDDLVQGG